MKDSKIFFKRLSFRAAGLASIGTKSYRGLATSTSNPTVIFNDLRASPQPALWLINISVICICFLGTFPMQLHSEEIKLIEDGICFSGTDEAGRGCLAGPVVAASVILRPGVAEIAGANDSKKLTEKKRTSMISIIEENALSIGVGSASPEEIDKINILNAALEAMVRSIAQLLPRPEFLLIDGNKFYDKSIPFKTIVGGDSKCLSIAVASIIAKVTRDRFMTEIADAEYPEYGFARHKGYGTREHYRALERFGPTPLHRRTFLKKMQEKGLELF